MAHLLEHIPPSTSLPPVFQETTRGILEMLSSKVVKRKEKALKVGSQGAGAHRVHPARLITAPQTPSETRQLTHPRQEAVTLGEGQDEVKCCGRDSNPIL